jgi:hypothetical protein
MSRSFGTPSIWHVINPDGIMLNIMGVGWISLVWVGLLLSEMVVLWRNHRAL